MTAASDTQPAPSPSLVDTQEIIDRTAATRKKQESQHHFLWDHEELGVDVWTAAVSRMHEVYDRYDVVEVMFSGGKDSMAALEVAAHVARERDRLPLKVLYSDEEVTTSETTAYLERLRERADLDIDWLCFPITHRNACTSEDDAWWSSWAPEDEHLWVREMPPQALHLGNTPWYKDPGPGARPNFAQFTNHWSMARNPGKKIALVLGIRAGESLIRRQVVSYHAGDNWIIKVTPALHKVYPIYDWTTEDLWTAAAERGWDYNRTYDIYEMLGMALDDQRIGTPFADEPIERLPLWQETAPDIWDKMLKRVPGAESAGRYATTELYAYRSLPEKPEGATWPEFIRQVIENNQSEAFRTLTSHKIRSAIRMHYRKTSDPILQAAHPITGISWEELLRMAIRGDAKNRKFLAMRRGDPTKYAEALQQHREELLAQRRALREQRSKA